MRHSICVYSLLYGVRTSGVCLCVEYIRIVRNYVYLIEWIIIKVLGKLEYYRTNENALNNLKKMGATGIETRNTNEYLWTNDQINLLYLIRFVRNDVMEE